MLQAKAARRERISTLHPQYASVLQGLEHPKRVAGGKGKGPLEGGEGGGGGRPAAARAPAGGGGGGRGRAGGGGGGGGGGRRPASVGAGAGVGENRAGWPRPSSASSKGHRGGATMGGGGAHEDPANKGGVTGKSGKPTSWFYGGGKVGGERPAMVHGSSYGAGAAAKAEPAVPPEQELRRTPEQKAMSPERLNLDNTQLTACPRLLGEERVRLLNYQSNHIREISNMGGLPNLIFLDLYNNRISRISGLEAVSGLRVLMLGKNRLRVIESLDALSRIDVLDLHSNQVCRQLPAPSLGCDDGWAAPTKTAVLLTKVRVVCALRRSS
jgi:hypothetical protein